MMATLRMNCNCTKSWEYEVPLCVLSIRDFHSPASPLYAFTKWYGLYTAYVDSYRKECGCIVPRLHVKPQQHHHTAAYWDMILVQIQQASKHGASIGSGNCRRPASLVLSALLYQVLWSDRVNKGLPSPSESSFHGGWGSRSKLCNQLPCSFTSLSEVG